MNVSHNRILRTHRDALAYRQREEGAAGGEPLMRRGVVPGECILLTAHRAGDVDEPDGLTALVGIVESLEKLDGSGDA